MNIIQTEQAPPAIGPYSQGTVVDKRRPLCALCVRSPGNKIPEAWP